MKQLLALWLLLLVLPQSPAVAGKGEIRFVETDVDLRSDGTLAIRRVADNRTQ